MRLFVKATIWTTFLNMLYVSPLYSETKDFRGLAKTAVQNVERNYSLLRSLRGDIEKTRSDSPDIRNRIIQSIIDQKEKTAAGFPEVVGDGTLSVAPLNDQYSTFTHPFVILDSDIRLHGFNSIAQFVFIVRGDKLAIYDPTNQSIMIRSRHTETKMMRDPRNVFYDETLRFAELLDDQKMGTAEWSKTDRGELLNLQFSTKEGDEIYLSLDKSRNFLPVFVAEVRKHINSTTEITYQELKVGGDIAWFPDAVVLKTWRHPIPVTEPQEFGWNQQFQYVIKNLKLAPEVTPKEFSIEIPKGTWVDNSVEKAHFTAEIKLRLP